MYAVISTGGKQYRLEQGDLIEVESLDGEVGDKVVFNDVLALGDETTADFGSPLISGAQVVGTIVEHGRGTKVKVLKFKRRKMYRKRTGHRQGFTSVKIDAIESSGSGEAPAKKKATPKARKPAEPKGTEKKVEKKAAAADKKPAAPKKAKPAAKKPATKKPAAAKKPAETAKAAKKPTKKAEPKSAAKKAQE